MFLLQPASAASILPRASVPPASARIPPTPLPRIDLSRRPPYSAAREALGCGGLQYSPSPRDWVAVGESFSPYVVLEAATIAGCPAKGCAPRPRGDSAPSRRPVTARGRSAAP